MRGLVAFVQDITEKKEAEVAIFQSKERWESLFNNSPNAIAIYRAVDEGKDFVFTDFNLTAQITDKIDREAVIGKRLSEIFPGAEELGFLDIFRRVWKTGETEYIKDANYKDDRIEGWRENIIYRLNTGEIVAIYRDISDRVRAEIALRESEQRFRLIIENADAIIILIDRNGIISLFDGKAVSLLGYKPGEFNGQPVFDVYKEYPDLNERFGKALNGERSQSIFKMKDFYFECLITPVSDVKESGALGIAINITEKVEKDNELKQYREHLEDIVQERTEELDLINSELTRELEFKGETERKLQEALNKEKELNLLKSRFISTASHEFRTPLTAVMTSVELIQRYGYKWDEERKTKHLERIKSSVEYLTNLMDDVLNVSRADAGKIEFKPVNSDIYDLCQRVVEEFRLTEGDKHKLSLIYPQERKLFKFDHTLMYTVLLNLISNAFKYSPDGGRVDLKVASDSEKLTISVRDEGIGVPVDDIPRLFEPFHRAENINEIRGTGLGLTIVKNAVDMHNGKINVVSALGKGTTFTVEIPIVE